MEVVRTEEENVLMGEYECSQMRDGRRSVRLWVGALSASLGAAVIGVSMVATRSYVKAEVRASMMKEQMVVQNAKEFCSEAWKGSKGEDCSATKCCKTTGFQCFEKTPGVNGCLEECHPDKGWTCLMPQDIVPLTEVKEHANWKDPQLYCWAVYTGNTGSEKKSYELELLQQQFVRKVSLFACDSYDVFSDVDAQIGSNYPTIKVDDTENEFHVIKRKDTTDGSWVNTGMFKQVWKAMGIRDGPRTSDWIVKVDADAVFVPKRLKTMMKGQPLSATGVYIENCKEVQWGLFGNLEVWSVQAFNALLTNIDSCSESIDWVTGTKWGPIGEDLFAQMCMDKQSVSKVQNFDVTTDAMCPGTRKRWGEKNNKKWKIPCDKVMTPAMHPFKKPEEYFSCLDSTLALDS